MSKPVESDKKYGSFRGVIVPLATPLNERGEYDPDGMERLVRHCLEQGAHGIFAMGSTGEALLFPAEQRNRIARHVVEIVAGQAPVYVGITALGIEDVVELGCAAGAAGADACVLLPHIFFGGMERAELVAYFARIAASVPVPLVAYSLGPHRIAEQTILELMAIDNVAGIKESSGDLPMIKRLAQADPFLSGRKRMLAGIELGLVEALRLPGIHGCIPSAANIAPGLFARIIDLCASGDFAAAEQLQPLVDRLNGMYGIAGYSWSGIKGVKTALELQGVCGAQMHFPFGQWRAEHCQALAKGLAALGDLSYSGLAQGGLLAVGDK